MAPIALISKLKEPSLAGFRFQIELGESPKKFRLEPFRIGLMLKKHEKVVCIPHKLRFAFKLAHHSLLKPQIEDIVKIDIAQYGRDYAPNTMDNFSIDVLLSFRNHMLYDPLSAD